LHSKKRVECFGVAVVYWHGGMEDLSVIFISPIEQYRIKRKENVEETSFWNNTDTIVNEHVNISV